MYFFFETKKFDLKYLKYSSNSSGISISILILHQPFFTILSIVLDKVI